MHQWIDLFAVIFSFSPLSTERDSSITKVSWLFSRSLQIQCQLMATSLSPNTPQSDAHTTLLIPLHKSASVASQNSTKGVIGSGNITCKFWRDQLPSIFTVLFQFLTINAAAPSFFASHPIRQLSMCRAFSTIGAVEYVRHDGQDYLLKMQTILFSVHHWSFPSLVARKHSPWTPDCPKHSSEVFWKSHEPQVSIQVTQPHLHLRFCSGAWIITGGMNKGIMESVGQLIQKNPNPAYPIHLIVSDIIEALMIDVEWFR